MNNITKPDHKKRKKFIAQLCIVTTHALIISSASLFNVNKSAIVSGYCSIIPNDYYYSSTWHLTSISMEQAWEISTGSSNISVAIIDSGIDNSFADLLGNVDSNSSIDCHDGTRNEPLDDPAGHGTSVASVIGAQGNNTLDFSGVCWDTNLLSYRVDSDYVGVANKNAIIGAIGNARYNHVPIANLSIGFERLDYTDTQFSYLESYINSYSGLLVTAVGNYDNNLDSVNNTERFYPACFESDNILCVGKYNEDGSLTGSNYGQYSVDLFAPGENIPTYPFDNETGLIPCPFGGTSAAAPLVAGTAALMLSVNPNLTTSELKSLIMNNVDQISSLSDKCVSGGKLNTYKAVKAAVPEITTFATFVNGIQSLPSNKHQFYKISLTPGLYHFESSSNLDMSGYLYSDIQNSPIAQSDNTSGDFSFDYFTNINKTVYLKITNNSNSDGNYSYKVTKTSNHYHSYDNEYVWLNSTKHRAICSCGISTLQGHVVSSNNTHLCLLCNGYASMGFIIQSTNPYIEVGNDSRLLNNGMIILGDIDYNLFINNELDINSLYLGESI